MLGRAVLTTEMSRTTRIWAVRASASTAHDRRGPSSGSGPDGGVWAAWCFGCIGPLIATGTEPVVAAGSVGLTGTPRGRAAVAAAGRAVLVPVQFGGRGAPVRTVWTTSSMASAEMA